MNSNVTRFAAVVLLVITPFAVCSCSDNAPTTTAGSAGLPAGWNGKHMKLGEKPGPVNPPKQAGAANN